MKKVIVIGGALALSAALVGCSSNSDQPESDAGGTYTVEQVSLPDGKSVQCIVWYKTSGYAGGGGVDCDWDNAK